MGFEVYVQRSVHKTAKRLDFQLNFQFDECYYGCGEAKLFIQTAREIKGENYGTKTGDNYGI